MNLLCIVLTSWGHKVKACHKKKCYLLIFWSVHRALVEIKLKLEYHDPWIIPSSTGLLGKWDQTFGITGLWWGETASSWWLGKGRSKHFHTVINNGSFAIFSATTYKPLALNYHLFNKANTTGTCIHMLGNYKDTKSRFKDCIAAYVKHNKAKHVDIGWSPVAWN